jgi:hypothetical protein
VLGKRGRIWRDSNRHLEVDIGMSVDQPATQPLLGIEDTGPTSHARFRAYVTHYSNTSFEHFADFSRTPPNITSKSTCLPISSPYPVRLKRAIDEDIPHQRQESCFSIRDSHAFTQLAERRSPFYESCPTGERTLASSATMSVHVGGEQAIHGVSA